MRGITRVITGIFAFLTAYFDHDKSFRCFFLYYSYPPVFVLLFFPTGVSPGAQAQTAPRRAEDMVTAEKQ